jgi:hypothetical protein
VVCRTPLLLYHSTHTAWRRITMMPLARLLVCTHTQPSFSYLCPKDGRHPKNSTYKTGPDDDLCNHLVFFSTFEELSLPIHGPMEDDAGVVKLNEPTPTRCLCVALAANMVGRVPLMPLFLAGNSTPSIPHKYSKPKESGYPIGCADTAAVDGRRVAISYQHFF